MTRAREIKIDVRLIDEIEEALAMDCAPPPEVIAPLAARAEAHRAAWRNPDDDDDLQAEARKALQEHGTWLELEEVHAVQRLRGWHRARVGNVSVGERQLQDVRWVLGNLRESLNDECGHALREFGLDQVSPVPLEKLAAREYPSFREVRASVLASMARDETCGECNWCWVRRLHIECCKLLDTVRVAGGVL